MGLGKHVVRTGVIGALGLGAIVTIAGPERIKALFTQAQTAVNDQIDKAITDPVALRAQLRSLQEEYPKRIADVRGDLAQLKAQQAQLKRDAQVSQRVVEMADSDMDKLSSALDHAQSATIQPAAYGGSEINGVASQVLIVFKGEKIDVATAQTKAQQVAATRNSYAARAVDIQRDLGYLSQQEQQLTTLATKLENEQTAFNTQMFDLDRQIDAIGRNDRMITILSDRQKSLDEQSRYRAGSLDHITSKLADLRARQEAQLTSLGKMQDHTAYEDAAKTSLDREKGLEAARKSRDGELEIKPTVIEINPDRLPARTPLSPLSPLSPTPTLLPKAEQGKAGPVATR